MTTQYTPTLKLALPVTGELSGTWGDVVNDNITSMIEQAIAGLATINSWTGNAHTLTTANGTTSESRCAMLVAATGGGAPSAAAEIICPAAAKLYVLQNNTSYAVTLKTSAGTGVAVAAGDTAFLFCDGTNVNSCVTTIVNGHITGNLTVDGNATINGNTTLGNATSDTVTVTARVASNVLPSADNTYDLGASANAWKDLYIDGTATMALVAISGGTINGVSIGATTPATFLAVDNLSLDGNTIASTNTNGNIVIAPNGTGDVQLDADTVRVGDSGAAVTLTSNGAGALTVTTGGAADLTLSTNSGTDSGTVVIANGANGNITLTPNGTGDVILSADRVQIGDSNTDTTLTTNGTGSLNLTTNNGTNSGTIQIAQGANGNITLTPNGTGSVSVPKLVWSNGTATRVPYLTTGGQFTDSANLTFNGTDLTVSGAVNAGTINATTLDLTNLEVTNIKAKDGTASITIADSTGAVSFANNVTLGDATTDAVTVNGYMGIGGAADSQYGLYVQSSALTGTNQRGIFAIPTATSAATSTISAIFAYPKTAAASFTVSTAASFRADDAVKGAGSTITNLHGLYIADQTQGTNNYGITSAVSSGTNKWNIYASGTAQNYFGGRVGLGTTVPVGVLDANGTIYSRFLNTTAPTLDNDTHAGEALYLRSGGTAGAENVQAVLAFGKADSSSQRSGAAIASIQTTSDTDQIGLAFYVSASTSSLQTMSERFRIGTTEAVFNEVSADYDFRVESDAYTHMLFVDAGNNKVGVNTSTPSGTFEVYNNTIYADTTNIRSYLGQDNNNSTGKAIEVIATNTGSPSNVTVYGLYVDAFNNGSASGTAAFYSILTNRGTAVFNESGGDYDFRVESDTNPYMFFVDAGNNKVALGGSTAGANDTLTVYQFGTFGSPGSNNAQITIDANANSGSGQASLRLLAGSGTTNRASRIDFLNGVVSTTAPRWTLLTEYNQDGTGDFNLVSQGSDRRMVFYSGSTVFNENGGDVDFRVESDASTHMLFVDAGNSRVGINNSTPAGDLDVIGTVGTYLSQSGVGSNQRLLYLKQFNDFGYSFNIDSQNTGALKIKAVNNGTETDFITWDRASAVVGQTNYGYAIFNENGVDADFRVESDANSHMIWVDASNNTVSIGTSLNPQTPANLRAYTGAHIGARVISSIQDLYYGGVGRTFTITGGSNGTTAYLSYTAMNQNGMREETYFFFNAGGNWSYSGPISQTSGTAPSVTISGNNTATLTIQIIGQGSNPNYYNGGIMNYEFYENYVSVA